MPPRLLSLVLLLFLPYLVQSGCYQQQLCCAGRNNTCKALDDGIDHIPTASPRRPVVEKITERHDPMTYTQYPSPYYESSGDGYNLIYPAVYEEDRHSRIGKLVLPDVIELEGSGADDIYGKYGPHEVNAPAKLVVAPPPVTSSPSSPPVTSSPSSPPVTSSPSSPSVTSSPSSPPVTSSPSSPPVTSSPSSPSTSAAPLLHHLIFGPKQSPSDPPEEILRYLDDRPPHLLIRIWKPLQLIVSAMTTVSFWATVAPTRPADCEVGGWSAWEQCVPDNGKCGTGVQQRLRSVTRDKERGGVECPPLKEMRTCFHQCPKRNLDDITTVALLLDYQYNATRSRALRNNVYWDLPEVARKMKEATYYCVVYEIGWVNRNCLNKQLTSRLFRGNRICAECQPEAQLHRNNGRCASDLEDGDEGFWKLIGPKSCNGIWRRLERRDNCSCQRDMKDSHPFLIV